MNQNRNYTYIIDSSKTRGPGQIIIVLESLCLLIFSGLEACGCFMVFEDYNAFGFFLFLSSSIAFFVLFVIMIFYSRKYFKINANQIIVFNGFSKKTIKVDESFKIVLTISGHTIFNYSEDIVLYHDNSKVLKYGLFYGTRKHTNDSKKIVESKLRAFCEETGCLIESRW